MPRLRPKADICVIRYPDAVTRIKAVCKARGYKISRQDAQAIWETYSDSLCASWLFLPDDDAELFETIVRYSDGYQG